MEERKLTGFAVITAIFLTVFIVVCMLCSCSTKQKVITEYVHVHDTIRTYHTDTIHKTNIVKEIIHDTTTVSIHDTLFHDREQIIVLNENGDTIKEKTKESLWQKTKEQAQSNHSESRTDSTDYYRARSDSLNKALHEEQSKYKEIIKTKHVVRWWEWLLIIGIVLSLIYGVKQIKKMLFKYRNGR